MKILVFSLDPVKILVFLLRSGGEMKILLDFSLDPARCGAFASILLRSGIDFCFDSCLILLKSGLDIVLFASIFA